MTTHTAALNTCLYQLAVSFGLVTRPTDWWKTVRSFAAESDLSLEEAAHIILATAMDMEEERLAG